MHIEKSRKSSKWKCGSIHCDSHHILKFFQMCEPVKKLKRCKYFRDITWTLVTYPVDNSTQQLVHCRCPKNSEAYLIKRHEFQTSGGTGYQYSFACSPQTVRDLNASLMLAQTWKRFGIHMGFFEYQAA